MVQGTDAHGTLFDYLKTQYSSDKLLTGRQVAGYPNSKTGVGIIDIMYEGINGWEVYELKTINEPSYRWFMKLINRPTGPEQRAAYIKSLITEKIKVNESGTSLYSTITGLKLKSKAYPKKTIAYLVDPVNPGMLYWYYENDKKEEALAKKMLEASLKNEIKECETVQNEETVSRLADLFQTLEKIATIADEVGMAIEVIEAALETALDKASGFWFFMPKDTLERYKKEMEDLWNGVPLQV